MCPQGTCFRTHDTHDTILYFSTCLCTVILIDHVCRTCSTYPAVLFLYRSLATFTSRLKVELTGYITVCLCTLRLRGETESDTGFAVGHCSLDSIIANSENIFSYCAYVAVWWWHLYSWHATARSQRMPGLTARQGWFALQQLLQYLAVLFIWNIVLCVYTWLIAAHWPCSNNSVFSFNQLTTWQGYGSCLFPLRQQFR
jgi:hypothetical protein